MKSILCCWVFYFAMIFSYAQSPSYQWVTQAGAWDYESTTDLLTDVNGNSYLAGFFSDTTIIGVDTFFCANGASSGILIKLNSAGDIIWAKEIGQAGRAAISDMAFDLFGNLVLTGTVSDTVYFGSTMLIASGYSDILVAKFDTSGNPIWAKSAGSVGGDGGSYIACDAQNNIIVSGIFQFASPFAGFPVTVYGDIDVFVAKYDALGSVLWAQSCGGMDGDGNSGLAVDANGDVYISGKSAFNFNYGAQDWNGFETIFIGKITASGNLRAVKVSVTGWGTSGIIGLEIDANYNLYAGLYVTPNFSFDSIPYPNPDLRRLAIIKLDSSLNVIWMKPFGDTQLASVAEMAVDASGNCFLTGSFQDTLTVGSSVFISPGFTNTGYVAKTDSGGNGLWAQINTSNHITDLSLDNNGCVYIAGELYSTQTFGSFTLTSEGQGDFFVTRLCESTAGMTDEIFEEQLTIYPNPAHQFITVKNFDLYKYVSVSDLSGSVLIKEVISNRLDVSVLRPGIYLMKFYGGMNENSVCRKLIRN